MENQKKYRDFQNFFVKKYQFFVFQLLVITDSNNGLNLAAELAWFCAKSKKKDSKKITKSGF